jgi:hypothetical protein
MKDDLALLLILNVSSNTEIENHYTRVLDSPLAIQPL